MDLYSVHNPILQLCSIITIIVAGLILIASFVPAFDFDSEVPGTEGIVFRILLLIAILGSLQGIF